VAGRTDSVVKARFSRGGKAAVKRAKEHLRYAVHRSNEQGQRQYREVWDREGQLDKTTAYERLDRVRPEDHIYRFTLSPHPMRQDAGRQLDLRSWTRDMLAQLERDAGQQVEWFAVTHEHRDHRHVHAVVISSRHLDADDFRAMRQAGDANARAQQREHQPQRDAARQSPGRDRELRPPRLRGLDRQVGG
jgi:type IV secretory pathway VirD2 relaxase